MRTAKPLVFAAIVLGYVAVSRPALAQDPDEDFAGFVNKLGTEIDVRTGHRLVLDELTQHTVIDPEAPATGTGGSFLPQIQLRGGNTQVNDPARDYVQTFPGFRPFVHSIQSETSAAAFGRNIVVTFNDSSGFHVSPNPTGPGVIVDQVLLSGFSVSNDGGRSWTHGSMPPPAGGGLSSTAGDPSIGVDRKGVFYFAGLGADAAGHFTIQVNRSLDGGNTWSDAAVVQQDAGSDKEWLAVGPDPTMMSRDNVYVTWTSFQRAACELRFGRSIDGGATWTAKTIFVPSANANPEFPQNCLQFSNPVVDAVTGTLYVPFLRFSNADQDFIQMLVSKDAGETFQFAHFNVPGAPDATVMPVTQPGTLTECGATRTTAGFSVNARLTIHGATNIGGSLTGLPRYVQASRLVLQPAAAAFNDTVYLAWSNSTSPVFGDPAAGSNVFFIRSTDGGATWSAPVQVNPAGNGDTHHVMPALAISSPTSVHVTYYTQHSDSSVDLDMANSLDGGVTFPASRMTRVTSTSAQLPPSNIPIPTAANPFGTTNYDRLIQQCYALGEYQSVTRANGSVYAAWGDTRNQIMQPVNALDPISGQTHAQVDVFFQTVKAQ